MKRFLLVSFATFVLTFFSCKTFDFNDSYANQNYDDTKTIQALLDSTESEIFIPKLAESRPYMVQPLKLENIENKKITFEVGTIILAKPKAFKNKNDCLLSIINCKNITISGFGATLEMRKNDYKGQGYVESKERHAICILGSEDITIEGFKISRSGGDGVYIGEGNEDKPYLTTKNINILNLVLENNYRNGIFVSSVENLLVENCSVFGTNGLILSDGIKFEATENSKQLKNITVKNSSFLFNKSSGIKIRLDNVGISNFQVFITFENCISDKNTLAAFMQVPKSVQGNISIVNCNFRGIQFIRVPKNLAVTN